MGPEGNEHEGWLPKCVFADNNEPNEIGGANDGRHSTGAKLRSSLTFWPLLQQFPPNRWLFVCDDTDGRLISRLSSAPLSGAPKETSPTPGRHGPRAPTARRFGLSFQFTVLR